MEFRKIEEGEYREFWEKSEQKTFLSAPDVIKLAGEAEYYGVFREGKLVAAGGFRVTKGRFGLCDIYAPRGVLVDYDDCATLEFFVKGLRRAMRRRKVARIRLEPAVERIERDIDGREVEGGYSGKKAEENLLKVGFKKVPYVEGRSQITWQFVLEVEGKSEEELLAGMKANTRRRLKQALELGMTTRELSREELAGFYEILEDTAERKKFNTRGLEYYQKVYDEMAGKGMVEFVGVFVSPKDAMNRLEMMKKKILAEEPRTIREKQDHADKLRSIETRMAKVGEILGEEKESWEEVLVAAGMFYTVKPEILHLSGGNRGKYLKLDGQYVLQWEMINKARREGYKRYNFYGIAEKIYEKPEGYGVYEFKRGFGGKVEELLGEYVLPVSWVEKIRN